MTGLETLDASRAIAAVAEGETTVEAIVMATLARVRERQPVVQAYDFCDPVIALRQARAARGPLAGMTVAVKDMIDTADQPTQHNSTVYAGHRPAEDAADVSILRSAGAVIFGKADTHEFAAAGRWPKARHPLDQTRTPGGSSSGSAAAVADFQAQIAIGTQTAGSLLRPASFCGLVALKPTHGLVSREGAKPYAFALDTIGFHARSVADIALLARLFDLDRGGGARPKPLAELKVGLCRGPFWARAEPASQAAVIRTAAALRTSGVRVVDVDLPQSFGALAEHQRVVMRHEGRSTFLAMARRHGADLHADFHEHVANADGYTRAQVRAATDAIAAARPVFDDIAAGYDALLTPLAVGEAPVGEATGDPIFQRMWTALHVPAMALPGHRGPNGLPIGLQLVAPRWHDAELVSVAAAIEPIVVRAGA